LLVTEMPRLSIRHESLYSYSAPVEFGWWRLLMRPLDTHATRLIEAWVETPPAEIRWTYDAYGNCVCYLKPEAPSDRLKVVNHLVVDRYPSPLAAISIDNPCSSLPIVYSAADRAILEPFIAPAEGDDGPRYRDWLKSLAPRTDEPAVEFLQRINSAIHADFTYGARDEEGTQGPGLTVELNSGTCRDFAWLMIESVRRFGFAARFATGYLYSPGQTVRGAGATHAWCEVFLPDLGWTEFDPTNALVESSSLIRVATTRTWQESDPMNGTVIGDAACDLKVAVDVDLVERQPNPSDAAARGKRESASAAS
jgi:transglutaminase-like putative cysteine protease